MTPAARMQAAIDVLDDWAPGRQADRLLLAWGRANRYAGSKDRAAVADPVYDPLRRWRSLASPALAGGGRTPLLSPPAAAEAQPIKEQPNACTKERGRGCPCCSVKAGHGWGGACSYTHTHTHTHL
mgnify:CR=1 FL=1